MSAPTLGVAVFDVYGELPEGTTLLEASAGTGKTYTIAALATRYVAEGRAELADVLLVTFGRAATSELRDRVRDRLVQTERGLRGDDPCHSPDELVRHLAAGVDQGELQTRASRLTRALADFDAATIATTHGFCQQMLGVLGLAGDLDPNAVFLPDIADLVDEVVDDLYLRRYADTPSPALSPRQAQAAARAAVGDPQARLEPCTAPAGSLAWHLFTFAQASREEVHRRKRLRRVIDYDDLVLLLRDALTDPVTGPTALARIRSRFSVVLVDEFQDTDPVQWQILRTAFHGFATLVLIGDPKQAVYAFRGGDVVTYVLAARDARSRATLGTCWRSDAPVVAAVQEVFRGARLGEEEIVVRPVAAAHTARRLVDGGPPLRLRCVQRRAFGLRGTALPKVDPVRAFVADDVAADVVRQLECARLVERRPREAAEAGGPGTPRALQPADLAVLTRRNADAVLVRDALVRRGVPAVFSGLSSVYATPAAADWLVLLSALEQPGSAALTAAVALTPFVGWDAGHLARAGDGDRDALADRVREWAQLLGERGVAAVLEAATAHGLAERLLRIRGGERTLTDLRHVGESLHLAATRARLGPAALRTWLRRRMNEADGDYADERSRRLETDAAAVQVVTVHASKGLEFPVVYVPFAWDRFEGKDPPILHYHCPGPDGPVRTVHVGGRDDPGYPAGRTSHLEEERAEDLRLLYVALTRAASQVVAWWSPSTNSACGPLSRMLFGSFEAGQAPPARVNPGSDQSIASVLGQLVTRSGGAIGLETVSEAPPAPGSGTPGRAAALLPETSALELGQLTRGLDQEWRRTSYSGLTAAAHGSRDRASGSEAEPRAVSDEPAVPGPGSPPPAVAAAGTIVEHSADATSQQQASAVASPMAGLPSGTGFGTAVHAVLERCDPGAPDLAAELVRTCRDAGTARLGADPIAVAQALEAAMTTPLGPLAGGLSLRDVPRVDRLTELEFELPLAGGDRGDGGLPGATLNDVADLLGRHLAPGEALAAYPDHLRSAGLGTGRLRGYLTGSLDAVLRLRPAGQEPVYLVVDYKTNWLGPLPAGGQQPLTAWDYRPTAMAEAMVQAHYPLQLVLYLVALHRFLRWRQPGYDPARHLGGGLYLFLRGMCGPATPVVDGGICGVMAWRPDADLVISLSGLLAGRRP